MKKFNLLFLFLLLFVAVAPKYNAAVIYPALGAKSDLLMDADTGVIYIADNIDEQLGIASLTKIMSIYVIFDEMKEQGISNDDVVVISDKVANFNAQDPAMSGVLYSLGQEITVGQLIDLSLIYSDNAAVVALAGYLCGSEDVFVQKMNEKAKKLGLDTTNFVNSTGLTMYSYGEYILEGTEEDDYNVSSARDMGLLSMDLVRDYPKVLDITSQTSGEYLGSTYYTFNYMLEGEIYEYEGVKGLKTGTTPEAGECFVGYLETEDRNYISVILDGPTTEGNNRFTETISMYDWAQDQRYSSIFNSDKPFGYYGIDGATGGKVPLYTDDVDILTSDGIYLELKKVRPNSEYVDDYGYLLKDAPSGTTIATLVFATPDDSINLQTVYGTKNNLEVPLVTHEDLKKENGVFKIFTSIRVLFRDVYENI